MNNISKTHQRFSERLRTPRVIENPGEFLGKNYEAVLNFWLILDELSEEQLRTINECYEAFHDESDLEWRKTADLAWEAAKEVVGFNYADEAGRAASIVTNFAACWTTRELIAMHKILEDYQQPLTFFPMFLKIL